jgi:hypothetical protein
MNLTWENNGANERSVADLISRLLRAAQLLTTFHGFR